MVLRCLLCGNNWYDALGPDGASHTLFFWAGKKTDSSQTTTSGDEWKFTNFWPSPLKRVRGMSVEYPRSGEVYSYSLTLDLLNLWGIVSVPVRP